METKEIVRTPENIVSSLMYYMWNAWCKEECAIAFEGDLHFWTKWGHCYELCGGPIGATEMMWAEMTEHNREKLLKRAMEKYDGRKELV